MRMAAALLALGTRCVAWEDPRGCVVRDVALDAVADGIAGGWCRGGGVVDIASWDGAPGVCALPASGTVDRTCIDRSGFVVDDAEDVP